MFVRTKFSSLSPQTYLHVHSSTHMAVYVHTCVDKGPGLQYFVVSPSPVPCTSRSPSLSLSLASKQALSLQLQQQTRFPVMHIRNWIDKDQAWLSCCGLLQLFTASSPGTRSLITSSSSCCCLCCWCCWEYY